MKVTLFANDENCTQIVSILIAHVTMFQKNELSLNFIDKKEQMKFIETCITNHILMW